MYSNGVISIASLQSMLELSVKLKMFKKRWPLLKKACFLFDLERSLQGQGQSQRNSTFKSIHHGLSCVKI